VRLLALSFDSAPDISHAETGLKLPGAFAMYRAACGPSDRGTELRILECMLIRWSEKGLQRMAKTWRTMSGPRRDAAKVAVCFRVFGFAYGFNNQNCRSPGGRVEMVNA
jgi:hypothetical protein